MVYRDKELYEKWKVSKSTNDLMNLVRELDPIIRRQVNRWQAGIVSEGSLLIRAKQLTIEAIKSFNPSSGSKLSSWVTTYLQKLGRYVTDHSVLHIPEKSQLDYNSYLRTKSELEDELNGPPTLGIIADRMGWSENGAKIQFHF